MLLLPLLLLLKLLLLESAVKLPLEKVRGGPGAAKGSSSKSRMPKLPPLPSSPPVISPPVDLKRLKLIFKGVRQIKNIFLFNFYF